MFPQLLHLPHFSFVLILAAVAASITNASMARRSGVSEGRLVILGPGIVLVAAAGAKAYRMVIDGPRGPLLWSLLQQLRLPLALHETGKFLLEPLRHPPIPALQTTRWPSQWSQSPSSSARGCGADAPGRPMRSHCQPRKVPLWLAL